MDGGWDLASFRVALRHPTRHLHGSESRSMADSTPTADILQRLDIFRAVAPHFGKVLPASFFQKTSTVIPGVERVHHLIEGIYKPCLLYTSDAADEEDSVD